MDEAQPLPTATRAPRGAHADGGPHVQHPTVHYVTSGNAAHIAVSPSFYRLDIDEQRSTWDRAYHLASVDGWVAPDDDLSVVDEDGTERYLLARWCRLLDRPCQGCRA